VKKLLLTAVVTGVLVAGFPAAPSFAADPPPGKRFVFSAVGTIPCATVLCDYWPVFASLGYRPCENPFPDQTYVDVLTQTAPTPPAGKKMILDFKTFPNVDWDTWVCGLLSNGSHNGGELGQGANILGELCDNFLGPDSPVPVGCIEEAQVPAEAGKRYVLRAYNYSDGNDDPAQYDWVFV